MTPPLPKWAMEKLLNWLKAHRTSLVSALGLLLVVSNPELRALIMLGDAVGAGLLLLLMSGYLKFAWHVVITRAPHLARICWRVAVRGVHGIALGRNILTLGMLSLAHCRSLLTMRRPG